ncbi:DinB family protein [Psychrobacillus psychrodurans]|uniref:DinB family protein n=1 Tax=Psychrobacillus psychrodurans TaxID=126157 RepID=A0A9X3RAT7_9BACI|nr:DinB family protein [Psychrobacillus psychrodurans]MCZ8534825.1 DinB family protein [Psychrobacillus psychrodurans]
MQKILGKDEYAPYYQSYVELVSEGDFVNLLEEGIGKTTQLVSHLSEEQGMFRYAAEKWTVKELLGHMADTERIMAHRLLSVVRGDAVSLPGFDEEVYVQAASFNEQSVNDLLQNLQAVRSSTIHLMKSIDAESMQKSGTANNSNVTVRALVVIILGHELHHCNILKDRYLASEQ